MDFNEVDFTALRNDMGMSHLELFDYHFCLAQSTVMSADEWRVTLLPGFFQSLSHYKGNLVAILWRPWFVLGMKEEDESLLVEPVFALPSPVPAIVSETADGEVWRKLPTQLTGHENESLIPPWYVGSATRLACDIMTPPNDFSRLTFEALVPSSIVVFFSFVVPCTQSSFLALEHFRLTWNSRQLCMMSLCVHRVIDAVVNRRLGIQKDNHKVSFFLLPFTGTHALAQSKLSAPKILRIQKVSCSTCMLNAHM